MSPERFPQAMHFTSKLNDGEQVEPASVKPVNVQVHQARQSNWEPAREYTIMARHQRMPPERPDIRMQSSLRPSVRVLAMRGSPYRRDVFFYNQAK